MSMRLPSLLSVPLDETALCAGCERVFEINQRMQCPACASTNCVPLTKFLNRDDRTVELDCEMWATNGRLFPPVITVSGRGATGIIASLTPIEVLRPGRRLTIRD